MKMNLETSRDGGTFFVMVHALILPEFNKDLPIGYNETPYRRTHTTG